MNRLPGIREGDLSEDPADAACGTPRDVIARLADRVKILSVGPIAYGRIENAGDSHLEFFMRDDYRCEPEAVTFCLAEVPLAELEGSACWPEDYLIDNDEASYELALDLAEAYASDPEQVPPVVLWMSDNQLFVWDGFHRLSGARSSGQKQVRAYIAL